LLGLLVLATPAAGDDRRVRTLRGDVATSGVQRLDLRLAPGEIQVEPSTDGRLRVELDVFCSFESGDCEERAERLELRSSVEGNTLRVEVEGMPMVNVRGLNLRGQIFVPRQKPIDIDFPAGELTVQGVQGDLGVDAGAGEVTIRLREHDVRSVRLGVGIGEASLSVAGRSIEGSGWLGHKVRWGEGTGPARVSVNLGVGEVAVRLE